MKKRYRVTTQDDEKTYTSARGVLAYLQSVNPEGERENHEAAGWCIAAEVGDQYIAETDAFYIEVEGM